MYIVHIIFQQQYLCCEIFLPNGQKIFDGTIKPQNTSSTQGGIAIDGTFYCTDDLMNWSYTIKTNIQL